MRNVSAVSPRDQKRARGRRRARAVPMLRSLTTTATTACARASLCRLSARPTLSGLVMQTQHLSRQLSTTSTVAALQAENARLHALVNETALDNQRLLLQVVPAILRVVPDEQVVASPALLQMLRDQVIRLEKVQVGHEVERLTDPEAAKYATATAAAAATAASTSTSCPTSCTFSNLVSWSRSICSSAGEAATSSSGSSHTVAVRLSRWFSSAICLTRA